MNTSMRVTRKRKAIVPTIVIGGVICHSAYPAYSAKVVTRARVTTPSNHYPCSYAEAVLQYCPAPPSREGHVNCFERFTVTMVFGCQRHQRSKFDTKVARI